jgi:adenylate cyclase
MKIDKITIGIGAVLTLTFVIFGIKYFDFVKTPEIRRPKSPLLEAAEILDLRFNDFKYKIKGASSSHAPVALIAVDDASVREIGRFPWSRQLISQLTEKVVEYGAQSIAFDAIFPEPEITNPAADLAFAKTITDHPNQIILGTYSENKFNFEAHQDLCVAEAFLKSGGDQLVKLNPTLTIDESTNAFDEINWTPLFSPFFESLQTKETEVLLQELNIKTPAEMTPYQKNNWEARKLNALFEYCKTWMTEKDVFLGPDMISSVTPLYQKTLAEKPELALSPLSELKTKIRKAYGPHPIPEYGEWTPNISILQTPAAYTASFIAELDPDGYVRRYPLLFRSGDKLGTSFIPSLALQSFLLSGPYRAEMKMKTANSGEKSIQEFSVYDTSKNPEEKIMEVPVDESGRLWINYYGRQQALPYISAKELFNNNPQVHVQQNFVDPNSNQLIIEEKVYDKTAFFKGRNLIFGATAVGLYDLRNTPLEANYPGPELHLTALANLLDHNFLKPWPPEAKVYPWIILILGICATLTWSATSPLLSFGVFGLILGISGVLDVWLFVSKKVSLHSVFFYSFLFLLFTSIKLYRYFTEEKQKREMKSTFSKYVSPSVVDELLKDAKNLQLGGRKAHMTVFFSDIRGFTTISEKVSPEELSRILNLYLTPMTEIVFQNDGTLDKYMGDAIMAFFGAPLNDPKHASKACRCTLKSLERLKALQKEFEEQKLPFIDIGIGLNTGEMNVGNMGSNIVQNYTVMGDAVNLGSRLEGLTKTYGIRAIISEFTQKEVASEFTTREIDRVRVKGKNEPVRIFELVSEGPAPEEKAKMLGVFSSAYELYLAKKFKEALVAFGEVTFEGKQDPVSKLFVERCQNYLTDPPDENWDGVFVMKTK